MDKLSIKFVEDKVIIPLEDVVSFSLESNLNSLLIKGTLFLKNSNRSFFNLIKAGSLVVASINDEINIPLRIIFFKKTPITNNGSNETIKIDLIHAWYFNNDMLSKCYSGNISSIIESVLDENKMKVFSYNISPSSDRPLSRYRLHETSQDFIQRIFQYGYKEKTPLYLYMDLLNNLNLISYIDLSRNPILTCATISSALQEGNYPPDIFSKYKVLSISKYKIISNLVNKASLSYGNFAPENFVDNGTIIKKGIIDNKEYNNEQSQTLTPFNYIYSNWNKNPNDAMGLFIRKAFNQNLNNFSFLTIFDGILIKDTIPGSLMKIFLPGKSMKSKKTGKSINLGEGTYMVKASKISFNFENNVSLTTECMLIPAYQD